MEQLKASRMRVSAIVVVTRLLVVIIFSGILRLSNGEINTACTTSALSTFTPCFDYLTGSSGDGSSPTKECCNTLKSAMTDSMDCTCLIVTGNVPVSIPFVRTLALSLPKQCNSGVPVQCKATGVPLPSPGLAILSPPHSPPPYYPPPPRSQRAAAVSVVKAVKPTSPPTSAVEPAPTSAVEPATTHAEKPATAPPPLFVPKATPADIRPVIDHTPTSANNSSNTISSSSSSILLLFFAFLYMFLC